MYDTREALQKGTCIELNGREYKIQCELGRGVNCLAYSAKEGKNPVVLKQYKPIENIDGAQKSFEELEKKSKHLREYLENHVETHFITGDSDGNSYLIVQARSGYILKYMESKPLHIYIRILWNIANALKTLHENDWILIDLKPENIFIMVSNDSYVPIFIDFDSAVKKNQSEDDDNDSVSSYTFSWAAPELKARMFNDVEPRTDTFPLGLMLFKRLFGRLPEAIELMDTDMFDYSSADGWDNSNPAVIPYLKEFFKGTLAPSPKCRIDDDRLCELLKKMKELTDKAMLNSNFNPNTESFAGREKEQIKMYKCISGGGYVWLTGEKGIGKTVLAKHYAELHKENYQRIIYGSCKNGISDFVCDDAIFRITNYSGQTNFKAKLNKIKELLETEKSNTLIIADGADKSDKNLKRLLGLREYGCNFILIDNSQVVHNRMCISLNPEPQVIIRRFFDTDKDTAARIEKCTGGNSKLVKIFCNLATERLYSEGIENLLKSLEKASGYSKKMGCLLNSAHLSEEETDVLCILDFCRYGVLRSGFCNSLQTEYARARDYVNDLISYGFVQKNANVSDPMISLADECIYDELREYECGDIADDSKKLLSIYNNLIMAMIDTYKENPDDLMLKRNIINHVKRYFNVLVEMSVKYPECLDYAVVKELLIFLYRSDSKDIFIDCIEKYCRVFDNITPDEKNSSAISEWHYIMSKYCELKGDDRGAAEHMNMCSDEDKFRIQLSYLI